MILPELAYETPEHPWNRPQGEWHSDPVAGSVHRALFGGQAMVIVEEGQGSYCLLFLDMLCRVESSSIDEAKAAAPEFAQAVLGRMSARIKDALIEGGAQ